MRHCITTFCNLYPPQDLLDKGNLISIVLEFDSISADDKLQLHVSNITETLIIILCTPIVDDHQNDLIILAITEAIN